MQEIKVFPVFFRIFISALHEIDQLIKAQNGLVNKQDYLNVLSRIDKLKEDLTFEDWEPFPDYIEILNKLDISNMLETLMRKTGTAFQNNQLMSTLENDLKKLETFAHLLNFLSLSYNKNSYDKKYAFKESMGIVSEALLGYHASKTDKLVINCIGNIIWAKPINNNLPINVEYEKIMWLLGTYETEGLQGFSEYLFSNIHEDSASNVDDYTSPTANIFDPKPVYLQFAIEEGNTYKKEYNTFIESLAANQNDEVDAENDIKTKSILR